MWPGEAAEEIRKQHAEEMIAQSSLTRADFDEDWYPIPAYPAEQNTEAVVGKWEVKDSGKKAEYASGMRRDTTEGKPKFSLMLPEGVPLEDQLLYRVAMHYMAGGVKYGDRNWEKSCNSEDLAHHTDALWRHFLKFVLDVEDGEDHAAAVVWNVNAVLLTRRNMLAELERADKAAVLDDDLVDEKPGPSIDQLFLRATGKEPETRPATPYTDAGKPPMSTDMMHVEQKPDGTFGYTTHYQAQLDAKKAEATPDAPCGGFCGDEFCPKCGGDSPAEIAPAIPEPDLSFVRVNIWFEPGEAKSINGRVITNEKDEGTTICVALAPGIKLVEIEKAEKPGFPKFGTPEWDAKVTEAAAEQAKNWPKAPEYPAALDGPCPDGGACHHKCHGGGPFSPGGACFRVLSCGPLSGVYPGNRWPEAVRQKHHDIEAKGLFPGRPDGP